MIEDVWFLLAPGPSMSQALADRVKGRKVCAVSNCYELAPWAEILVAADKAWWLTFPQAYKFAGRKFSAMRELTGGIPDSVERVKPATIPRGANSGVVALDAVRNLGGRRMVLLGFDSHGSHYFGEYKKDSLCRPTAPNRRAVHRSQFAEWRSANRDCSVINCTPGSMLKAFQFGDLNDYLETKTP